MRASGVLLAASASRMAAAILTGIAVAADMHVERCGIGAQQVVVNRRDLDAAVDHFGHDRIDLGFQQHQVAHRHRFAVHRLERDPAAERQRWPDGDAIQRHRQIGARKSIAMDIAGDGRLSPNISSTFCQSIAWAWALEMNGSVKMFQSVVCAFAPDADDAARIEAASPATPPRFPLVTCRDVWR